MFMTSQKLRKKYIEFYKSKNHAEIHSASLLPENDPSVLFTTAGMSPLVPFLLGEKHPAGKRLVNSQKCIRTGDIDEVGDGFHHTFFEMLGHWSLGDYFKKEAIEMSFEFLTKVLGLEKENLAFTVFAGDDLPRLDDRVKAGNFEFDKEAMETWKNLGISEHRIKALPKKDNWWELSGNSGPCGPCTEMFYWTNKNEKAPDVFDTTNKNWVEIGNDVLMQYEKIGENKYQPAKQKNIDNGTGLERLLAVMNGLDDDYKTDLFLVIIQKIEELSGKKYDDSPEIKRAMRIIADHIKAATFIIADGILPDKNGAGYVLRKLIRRARYYFDLIGADNRPLGILSELVGNIYKDIYPELFEKRIIIDNAINDEEITFSAHLHFGGKMLKEIIEKNGHISGDNAFLLYATYGFPFELISDIAKEKKIDIDVDDFNKKKEAHQELSRTSSAGMFKGGLANQSEMAIKYHTATHLTLATLRKVLGEHVFQRGCNITDERMRLDFSHNEKMTSEQIKEVEDLVNEQIKKNMPVECAEMGIDEAKNSGAMGIFENKYGDRVKVYSVGNDEVCFSKEICGGPHVKNTGELGHFKIIKEEASSAGVRRIKATLFSGMSS
jgi:alanyl-tRNA synthetase